MDRSYRETGIYRKRFCNQCHYFIDYRIPFYEAVGLFNNPIVEDGYTLVVNKENPIKSLSSQQIKDLFDEEIVNWKELGGSDIPVQTFRLEDLSKHYSEEELGSEYEYAGKKIGDLIRRNQGMIAFVPQNLIQNEPDIRMLEDRDIPAKDVLLGTEWYPTATPSPSSGYYLYCTELFGLVFSPY